MKRFMILAATVTASLCLASPAFGFAWFGATTTVTARVTWHIQTTGPSSTLTYDVSGRVYDQTRKAFLPVTAQSSTFHMSVRNRSVHAHLRVIRGHHSPCFYMRSSDRYDLESALRNHATGLIVGPDSSATFTKAGICPLAGVQWIL